MERIEQINLNPHSVEITRGANGKVALSVKVYGATPEQAAEQAEALFNGLAAQDPAARGGPPGLAGGGEGCPYTLEIPIAPPERGTWHSPGAPASISGVDGCPAHRDALSEDRLWALVDEHEDARRRGRDCRGGAG